jgi:hypothetical protein
MNPFREAWRGGAQQAKSQLPWLAADSLAAFPDTWPAAEARRGPASKLSETARVDRALVAAQSRAFHIRAGTLTAAVAGSLNRYSDGVEALRTAHQPEFLAAMNVVGQAAVCHRLNAATGGRYVEAFFLLDYDQNDDRNYRSPGVPAPWKAAGTLKFPAPRSGDPTFMFGEARPEMAFVEKLLNAIESCRSGYRRLGWSGGRQTHGRDGVEWLGSVLRRAAVDAKSFADFNAIVLSRFVNEWLGLPTIFIPGSEVLPLISEHLELAWIDRKGIVRAAREVDRALHADGLPERRKPRGVPLWYRCGCDRRFAVEDRQSRLHVDPCVACSRGAVDGDDRLVANLAAERALVPRVLLDDILDGLLWGYRAGVDYHGGLSHYAHSALVAQRLSVPRLPVYLSGWDRSTPDSELARLTGRTSVVAALLLTPELRWDVLSQQFRPIGAAPAQ